MSSRDFLHKNARTPRREYFMAAGAVCRLSTNFAPILEAARESFLPLHSTPRHVDFQLRLWVDVSANAKPPWPKPYLRGLGRLIFAGFDSENSFLVDRRTQRVIGRFSLAMGADQVYWKTVVFPNLLTLLGPSVGVTEFHCACVAREGGGILLWGPSGSGKSTLTFALARRGFSFLSDDWTFFSQIDKRLRAWGVIARMKLLPPAVEFFPELGNFKVGVSVNGEKAYEFAPDFELGLPRSRFCEPRCLIFLERRLAPEFTLTRMPAEEAIARLEGDLLAETSELLSPQLRIIESLVGRQCWLLRYGGSPHVIAEKLVSLYGMA